MAEFQYTPSTGLRDALTFPDPATEADAREQFMTLFDQIRDAHNTHLAENVTLGYTPHGMIYETGFWTPVLGAASVDGAHTYTTQFGRYTRINNLVTVSFRIVLSAKGATMSGGALIKGLPFAASSIAGYQAGAIGYYAALTGISTYYGLNIYVTTNNTSIAISLDGTNAAGFLQSTNITGTTEIRGSMTYEI